jgi:DNA-binding XRE family transcriptional regulator
LKLLKPRPYKEQPDTLGEHLRKRRIELGLFQKDVAQRLQVNEWTYLGWEHDRRKPSVRFWPRITSFLEYDPLPTAGTLGERIKAKRWELGLSQRMLSKLLGVDHGTVRCWEKGEWVPYGKMLFKIRQFVEAKP